MERDRPRSNPRLCLFSPSFFYPLLLSATFAEHGVFVAFLP